MLRRIFKKIFSFLILFTFLFVTACNDNIDEGKKEIYINSVYDFIDFAGRVKQNYNKDNFKDYTVYLQKDLDFRGLELNPIGSDMVNYFDGTFEGNNYTLKNVKFKSSGNRYLGIFGVTGSNSVIKNLNVENVTFSSNHKTLDIGGIVGFMMMNSKVQDCSVKGSIKIESFDLDYAISQNFQNFLGHNINIKTNCFSYVGGIVGTSYGIIYNSSVEVDLYGDSVGGIAGNGAPAIIKCNVNNSNINSMITSGGLIGRFINHTNNYRNIIENSINDSIIQGHGVLGGLIGCYNGRSEITRTSGDFKIKINETYCKTYCGTVIGICPVFWVTDNPNSNMLSYNSFKNKFLLLNVEIEIIENNHGVTLEFDIANSTGNNSLQMISLEYDDNNLLEIAHSFSNVIFREHDPKVDSLSDESMYYLDEVDLSKICELLNVEQEDVIFENNKVSFVDIYNVKEIEKDK